VTDGDVGSGSWFGTGFLLLAKIAGRADANAAVPAMPGKSSAPQTSRGWFNARAVSANNKIATEQISRTQQRVISNVNPFALYCADDITNPAKQPNTPPAIPTMMPGNGANAVLNHGAFICGSFVAERPNDPRRRMARRLHPQEA
jgi:hypothetical protein